jgi:hypothetical protein
MTQEVVTGQDVVDLETIPARKPLAYIALEERVVVDELVPLAIAEHALVRGAAAGLAVERCRHACVALCCELVRAYHTV